MHVLLYFFFPLLLINPVLATGACGNAWTAFDNRCYRHFLCGCKPRTQAQAEVECFKMGGHLASINTAAESTFLDTISSVGGVRSASEQPWIGLQVIGGTWKWIDGSIGSGYQWAVDQPDNAEGSEYCALFLPDVWDGEYVAFDGVTGLLNDTRCSHTSTRFICERNPGVVALEPDCDCDAIPTNTELRALIKRQGQIIHRTLNKPGQYHQYNLNRQAAVTNGQTREPDVGYYVNKNNYNLIKQWCPELRPSRLYQNKREPRISHLTTHVDNAHKNWQYKGEFYCAPTRDYCGANFELVEIQKIVGHRHYKDSFLPSSLQERHLVLTRLYPEYRNKITRSICWIWK